VSAARARRQHLFTVICIGTPSVDLEPTWPVHTSP
jgi:hypothetical protein